MNCSWMCRCNLEGITLEDLDKHCVDGTHDNRKLLQFIKAIEEKFEENK